MQTQLMCKRCVSEAGDGRKRAEPRKSQCAIRYAEKVFPMVKKPGVCDGEH